MTKARTEKLSPEEVARLLSYDRKTGVLAWKIDIKKVKAGDTAGVITRKGYRQIQIRGRSYQAGRLIFAIVYGAWPNDLVDHRDGNRSNDVFSNLRLANGSENCWNSARSSRNRSGIKGVCYDSKKAKWQAYIKAGTQRLHLGRYASMEEAVAARRAAEVNLHGEFIRLDQ